MSKLSFITKQHGKHPPVRRCCSPPLNLLLIASLSICFCSSTFSPHSLTSLLPFILKIYPSLWHLSSSSSSSPPPVLHLPLPCISPAPLLPPLRSFLASFRLSGSSILARRCVEAGFFFFFSMPVMSQVEFECVCVCVWEWYRSPPDRVKEMIHLLAASLPHTQPPHPLCRTLPLT